MLRVPTSNARSGMTLGFDIAHPATGRRLLGRGYVLDDRVIERLRGLHIHEVWIEYPELDAIRRFVAPQVMQQHGQVVSLMADLFSRLHANAWADLDFVPYRNALRSLIESMARSREAAVYVVELGGGRECTLRHASEVCFLSLLLGLRLRTYLADQRPRLDPRHAQDVVPLGLGALLHDIGHELTDPAARKRFIATGDEAAPGAREHVWKGYRFVSGVVPPAAATVVLHHHQGFDGSGFPTHDAGGGLAVGLGGEMIHVFARIVAVADVFDRLRHHPDGTVVPRVKALRQMLGGSLSQRLDPVVLRALPTVVPAYPPGTIVQLSDGREVVVTDWRPMAPCEPIVRPLGHPGPEPGEPDAHAIDLLDHPGIVITQQDGIDVSRDNFRLKQPASLVAGAARV